MVSQDSEEVNEAVEGDLSRGAKVEFIYRKHLQVAALVKIAEDQRHRLDAVDARINYQARIIAALAKATEPWAKEELAVFLAEHGFQ